MSNLPQHTEDFLVHGGGTWRLPGAYNLTCEGAAFHSPRPLFVTDTVLVRPEWGPTHDPVANWAFAPHAWLCGTCADNLAILLQMLHATGGDLDWSIRREFGNGLRALALRGWEFFCAHRPARPEPAAP